MEESPVKENVGRKTVNCGSGHTPKLAKQKFGGKRQKFETVADMLYYHMGMTYCSMPELLPESDSNNNYLSRDAKSKFRLFLWDAIWIWFGVLSGRNKSFHVLILSLVIS